MSLQLSQQHALKIWHDALSESVRRDGPDLSARQMAIAPSVYMEEGLHTVRALPADLNISKPAVTRALDRLADLGFVRRQEDPRDRRSVLVLRTVRGSVFLSDFAELVTGAAGTGA